MPLQLHRPKSLRLAVCATVLVVLLGTPVFSQAPVGSISGTIKDASGGVIPGATITVTSVTTGAQRAVQSNESGFYLVPTLLPGDYKVTIEYSGFATYVANGIVVAVGQNTAVNPVLSVKQAQEIVQVQAENVAQVDTFQSTISGVVNVRQIDQLPLNGRNYLELARLQPGVEIQSGQSFDPTKTRYTGISVGGRQGREARITIDGIDAVDEHVGTTTLNLSQESIQEFQVSTSSADSSTGLSATGAVNIITRRGTNSYHGSAFAFGRAAQFSARPSMAATKPDFDREQWGTNIGMPVVKDKLFFFGNFENTNESSSLSIATPYFPSITSYAAPFYERSATARADWRLPKSNDFFFRWSWNDNSNLGGFGGAVMPSRGNYNDNTTHQFVWGLDTPFTSRLTNGFRAAFTDFKNYINRPDVAAQALTIPGIEGYRIITDDGLLDTGPDINTPQHTFEKFEQFRDDLTYSRGNHTLRWGGDVTHRRIEVVNFAAGFPAITVKSPVSRNIADVMNAGIVSVTLGNKKGIRIPATPDNAHYNTRFSWYFDEVWRAQKNLTFSVGVRYEVDTHPLNNDLDKPVIAQPLLPFGIAPTPINKKNFAPHAGIAWDPFKDGKTSIRAGFGLYYAMRVSNLVTNERAQLAPFNSGNATIGLTAGTAGNYDFNKDGKYVFDFSPAFSSTATLTKAIPVIAAGQQMFINAPQSPKTLLDILRSGVIISNDLMTPYSQQANFGVQRQLPGGVVVDTNFVYSRSVHEFTRDIDQANLFPGNGKAIILGDGLAPTAQITVIHSDGFSQYKAFTVRADKRFAQRYQFTASYALSRLNTTSPDGLGLGAGALVNRDQKANYGPGALDRTNRLTLNGIVDLPKGFRASLIAVFNSGLPTTAIVGSADLRGDGVNGAMLPGTKRGSVGREVGDVAALNALIRDYNLKVAGTVLPRGGRAPFLIEYPDTVKFGDSFMSQDFQLTKVFKIKEHVSIDATAQVFNLFNISNLVGSGGLPTSAYNGTLTNISSDSSGKPTGGFTVKSDGTLLNSAGNRALAGVDRSSGFASFSSTRPAIPTGTGLPRAFQFGLRLSF